MTSINAIRFNATSGAMVFDEMRGWNPQNMKIPSAQKMKSVVEDDIIENTGLVAGYGNTGTSAIGDELRFTIKKRITQKWREAIEKKGEKPSVFMTVEDVAQLTYQIICDLKHKHTNELLVGRFGFDTNEYIQGSYKNNIEIKDKDVLDAAEDAITWKKPEGSAKPVFCNAGIVAGYDPKSGFRIFHLSMMEQIVLPVREIFLADGSGRDQCEVIFSDFAAYKSVSDRRGNIAPTEGLLAALQAIVAATRRNLGVGGYTNIILFDGEKKGLEKIKFILDDRARLAAEITKAFQGNFLTESQAISLIDELCFQGQDAGAVQTAFLEKHPKKQDLFRYLRGYGYKD